MPEPEFDVIFATSAEHLEAVQALRYDVFVRELGGDGDFVDHENGLEKDRFDPLSRHMMLLDRSRGSTAAHQLVGVYRLLDLACAKQAGGFYSAREYDLDLLVDSGRKLLELGRSCLRSDYRGGSAMFHLWSALAKHILAEKVDILFGTASFHGTDIDALTHPLALLHHRHLAPEALRVVAKQPCAPMDVLPENELDRKTAMVQIPALIKAYLRLGGCVGEGAFLDHQFNTTDVCLVLDVANMPEKQRRMYLERGER